MLGLGFAHRGFMPFGFGGFGSLFAFALFVGFVAVVVFLLASGSRRHHAIPANQGPAGDPAIEIARDRLARGEIDAEQYTRIIASLTGVTVPPRQA